MQLSGSTLIPMVQTANFERGAAAETENQDRYNGKENRHHVRDGMAGLWKSPASVREILSKDSGAKASRYRRYRATAS
jgi:hypothetical protein